MLKKLKKPEIIEKERIKLVKITDNRWTRKCVYCKLYLPSKDKRKKYWEEKCSLKIHRVCCGETRFIPLKYIRKLKYAIIQTNKV